MNNITKKHFVFDLDDTITDSYDFNQQMFVDTFLPYLDVSNVGTDKFLRDLHYNGRGTSMHTHFEEATQHFSLNLNPVDLVRENELLHIKNVDKIKIFDAVAEVIAGLKTANKKVSICTNRQTESLMKILDNHGITSHFSNIISCSDAGHEKPDPYCLLELVEKSGEPKEDFIYFGDSKTDYLFARDAGVDFIIVDHYLNEKKFYKMILQAFM